MGRGNKPCTGGTKGGPIRLEKISTVEGTDS